MRKHESYHCFNLARLRDVGLDPHGIAAVRSDMAHDFCAGGLCAAGDGHACAGRSKGEGGGTADAGAAAGDKALLFR